VRFRPCIDLHQGRVKQIVGATFSDASSESLVTNFETAEPASHFAEMYQRDGLEGGHVIMLGPGNVEAAESALAAYPGGLQVGGGVTPENAAGWLDKGAAKVIVTSFVFADGKFSWDRLRQLTAAASAERLVLDLSCQRIGEEYAVVINRWQTVSDLTLRPQTLQRLAESCSEFLVHAADAEGRQGGVDVELVRRLAGCSPIPVTYAGGVRDMDDLLLVEAVGQGRLDVTVGSALDIFGGAGLRYRELVAFDEARR